MREIPADDRRHVRDDDAADAAWKERPPHVAEEPHGVLSIEVLDEMRRVYDRDRPVVVAEAAPDVAVLDALRPVADLDAEQP